MTFSLSPTFQFTDDTPDSIDLIDGERCCLMFRAPDVDNWMIIELQGTLETKEDVSLEGKAIGDLHFDAKVGICLS